MNFIDRMVEEREELRTKITKLYTFIKSDGSQIYSEEYMDICRKQLQCMIDYESVLDKRIRMIRGEQL